MEITSLIISIVSLVLGAFTFWFYDRKTKRQDAKINEYQLKNFEEEETKKKKASVRGNVAKGLKNSARTLKIFNSGDAVAKNVRLELLSCPDSVYCDLEDIFPYRLMNPQDNISIDFSVCKCEGETDKKLEIKLIWDDDFQNDNSIEQVFVI